ncbi:hypothetical protein VDGL01_04873 [Verticillium dahliae]
MILTKLEKAQRRYLTSRRRTREEARQETDIDEACIPEQGPKSLLQSWLPRISAWLRPDRTGTPDKSFVPCPQITFLVDGPPDIVCTICRVSVLSLSPEGDSARLAGQTDKDNRTPAIMPCGHLACAGCLSTWFEEHDTCPFCRYRLVYRKCGHKIQLRRMTEGSIYLIPATIPDGGVIPDLCFCCHEEELRRTAEIKLEACRRRFRTARGRFQASMGDEQAQVLLERKAELERVMLDEFHVKAMSHWLSSW